MSLTALVLGLIPLTARACAVCYGAPNSAETKGMNGAIFVMLGVTYAVIGGAIAFFYGFWRRSRRIAASQKADALKGALS